MKSLIILNIILKYYSGYLIDIIKLKFGKGPFRRVIWSIFTTWVKYKNYLLIPFHTQKGRN